MAVRAIWRGELKLAAVTCEVVLHNALQAGDSGLQFHLINPQTGNRINTVAVDPDAGEVDRAELVKAFEVAKGRYVLLTKKDFAAAKLKATKVLEVERFVDAGTIDRIYWDAPYYLSPADKAAAETFAVVRKAIEKSGQIGVGRFVMHNREHFCAVEPRDDLLLVTTLWTEDEIRTVSEAAGTLPRLPRPSRDMLSIADRIIAQKAGKFRPQEFRDTYQEALVNLLKRKQRGKELEAPREEPQDNVVDLMQALKASLGKGGAPGERAKRYTAARARTAKARTTRKRRS